MVERIDAVVDNHTPTPGSTYPDDLSPDAVRYLPAPPNESTSTRRLVHGLLIPHQPDRPLRTVDLPADSEGKIAAAVSHHLGGSVDAVRILSDVDFLINDEGHYLDSLDRYTNVRATALRGLVAKWVAAGEYTASDDDRAAALAALEHDPFDQPLLGPVIMLGVDTQTAAWTDAPTDLVEQFLALDRWVTEHVALPDVVIVIPGP